MSDRERKQNTDRELWRERENDFYADSIHVTQDGRIGMNVGGTVFVMPIKAWHDAVRLAQSELEPVAWIWNGELFWHNEYQAIAEPNDKAKPLYTAPPKCEWVGLTDEEIKEIIGPWGDTPIKGYTRQLFDKIEAKLKDKNG